MSSLHLAILETQETIFFARPAPDGPLRQRVEVLLDNRTARVLQGQAIVVAGGEEVRTPLSIRPGQRLYRCDAPLLWSRLEPVPSAPVTVTARDETGASFLARGAVSVGTHRPWTVYLLSDTCVDYTWAYENLEQVKADAAAVLRAEMAACRATYTAPRANQNRYNILHTSELQFFLEQASPAEIEELARWTQSGHLTLSPYHNMALTTDLSLEESIRQFYPARALEQRLGIPMGWANHQETPTIAWIQATILGDCGIGHLVKSILPYECPWNGRLMEPPLYYWEGPDGGCVLVRHRKTDYVEGGFVLKGLAAIDEALHQRLIPTYEALGATYPLNALALVGCYGDLAPKTREFAATKVQNVAAYNARGWEYPRLVNASHEIFWRDVEAQLSAQRHSLPVLRGDYGTAWDAWPMSLAHAYAGWRRAQERSAAADCLAAIVSTLDYPWFERHRAALADGWANLLHLADHAWNGSSDGSRALNAGLRRDWQEKANAGFDSFIGEALASLAGHVPAGAGQSVLAFNPLGWVRSGIVRVRGLGAGPFVVRDGLSGEALPCQLLPAEAGSQGPVLSFKAGTVPSFGYRTFGITAGSGGDTGSVHVTEHTLENEFYRLEVSPLTGGIASLYDKVRARELVDDASPYHLNQFLYRSGEAYRTPTSARVTPGACGPVQGQLVIRTSTTGAILKTTVTLYAGLEGVEIRNDLHKVPCADREQIEFAFPFAVPGRRYRLETPGVLLHPGDIAFGGEQRPGSGQALNAMRHFVEVYNDEVGVTLVSLDGGLIQFGHCTQATAPQRPDPHSSTILAVALGNTVDWDEIVRNQDQVADFCFRYVLYPHGGGCDAVAAVHRGAESAQDLLAIPLEAQQEGTLPSGAHSFLHVEPEQAIATTLKVAGEGLGGPCTPGSVILRLWEPGVSPGAVCALVDATGWGQVQSATLTDPVEREREALSVSGATFRVGLARRGLATVKLALRMPS